MPDGERALDLAVEAVHQQAIRGAMERVDVLMRWAKAPNAAKEVQRLGCRVGGTPR